MSLTTKRQDFATALTGVPDVTGHAHRPASPAIGDAWPMWSGNTRNRGTAFVVQWRVRVMLPQDEAAASVWIDAHWDALFYALEPHGFVGQSTPVLLNAAGGDLYALEITLTAEE
jgi:hypothetical protein